MSRFVACVVAITAVAACRREPATPKLTHADAPGISNFSRLDPAEGRGVPMVGFGGATQPSAMAWLKSQGFRTVINLRLATEEGADVDAARAAAQAAGLTYLHLPFAGKDPDDRVVEQVVAALGARANQPVYIHCHSATRVAAVWMIRRVLVDGWDVDRARVEAEAIALKPADAVGFATRYLASHPAH